jgi:hypothetical protein
MNMRVSKYQRCPAHQRVDHHASIRAATNFKLDLDEMEDRYHLTFATLRSDCRMAKESSMKPANPSILTINGVPGCLMVSSTKGAL